MRAYIEYKLYMVGIRWYTSHVNKPSALTGETATIQHAGNVMSYQIT